VSRADIVYVAGEVNRPGAPTLKSSRPMSGRGADISWLPIGFALGQERTKGAALPP